MLLEPLGFLLHRLLEQDILFTVLIDVLEQIDASLVLTAPLLLTCIPLLLILHLGQFLDHLFVRCLVILSILIVSLELLNFLTTSHTLFCLNLLDSSLTIESCLKKNLITIALNLLSLFTQLFLGCIVRDEFEVTLTIEHELLFIVTLLLSLLDSPLFTKHSLFLRD